MTLPVELAAAVNALYNPPATFANGIYYTACNATVPEFGVTIGGRTFWINPADMLLRNMPDSLGDCLTTIVPGGPSGPYILGAVFLQNVLAVFDVGAAEMRFAAREKN